jgi:hypothetical protein
MRSPASLLPRRWPVALAGAGAFAALACWFTAPALGQPYPDKPIRLIVPAAPGGPTDIPARLLSQILPRLGQPVVIENRAGAGGAIGARAVVAAAPDGYTLLVGNTSVFAVAPAVSASAGYDPASSPQSPNSLRATRSWWCVPIFRRSRRATSSPMPRAVRDSSTMPTPGPAGCRT